jgi:hypothetical protein
LENVTYWGPLAASKDYTMLFESTAADVKTPPWPVIFKLFIVSEVNFIPNLKSWNGVPATEGSTSRNVQDSKFIVKGYTPSVYSHS